MRHSMKLSYMISSKFTYFFYLPQANRQRKSARGRFLSGVMKNYFFLATTRIISKHCLA